MELTPEQLKSVMRRYLCAFIQRSLCVIKPETEYLHNFHIEVLAAELEECLRGETRRLIVNLPPRSLKSQCTSVAFPAFILGHNPAANIICVSYGQELANKLASDSRDLMKSAWFQDLFPDTKLAPGRQALHDFTTTRNGGRFSTSVRGVLTGRGADFIIIDDPQKAVEAFSDSQRDAVNSWFDNTVTSRLDKNSKGCIILVMQRLHEDDLVGHVMKSGDWRVLKFPAIAEEDESYTIETILGTRRFTRKAGEALHPAQEPLEALMRTRRTIGEYNFAGQYQQAPAPLDGGMIKRAWFKTYTPLDRPTNFDLILQSWDTANKPTELNDFSACTTWGLKDKKLYLLNVLRRRMEYPELIRTVRAEALKFSAKNILIEDRASGIPLIQELRREFMSGVAAYAPTVEKRMRMSSCSNLIENGSVYLPEAADWLDEYLHELVIFPNGQYDDQADSTSQALDWIKNKLSAPGSLAVARRLAREVAVRRGDQKLVREIDEEDGLLSRAPKAERPSGPAVFDGHTQQPTGPAVYFNRQEPDPELKRLKSRLFWKEW